MCAHKLTSGYHILIGRATFIFWLLQSLINDTWDSGFAWLCVDLHVCVFVCVCVCVCVCV